MGSQSFSMSTLLLLLIGFSATLSAVSEQPTSNITQIFDQPIPPNISRTNNYARYYQLWSKGQWVEKGPTSNISQLNPNISQAFEDWMKEERRVYSSSEEKSRRFELFKKYYLDLQKRNKEEGKSYRPTRFADRSEDDVYKGCFIGGRRRLPLHVDLTSIPWMNYDSDPQIQINNYKRCYQLDRSKDPWIENGPTTNISQTFDQLTSNNISQIFEDWMKEHRIVYSSSEEKARRFEFFKIRYLVGLKRSKGEGKTYRLYRSKGCTARTWFPKFIEIPIEFMQYFD